MGRGRISFSSFSGGFILCLWRFVLGWLVVWIVYRTGCLRVLDWIGCLWVVCRAGFSCGICTGLDWLSVWIVYWIRVSFSGVAN